MSPRDRPLHLRPRFLALAFLGGAVGTGLRLGLTLMFPGDGLALGAILAINVLGAFLLGFLLEALVRRGPDVGPRRTARILVGTGVLGGFTTYSTLATNTVHQVGQSPGLGVLYGVLTVVLGLGAAALGVELARRAVGTAGPEPEVEDA